MAIYFVSVPDAALQAISCHDNDYTLVSGNQSAFPSNKFHFGREAEKSITANLVKAMESPTYGFLLVPRIN